MKYSELEAWVRQKINNDSFVDIAGIPKSLEYIAIEFIKDNLSLTTCDLILLKDQLNALHHGSGLEVDDDL